MPYFNALLIIFLLNKLLKLDHEKHAPTNKLQLSYVFLQQLLAQVANDFMGQYFFLLIRESIHPVRCCPALKPT